MGGLDAKSEENTFAKSAYSAGTIVGAFSTIKPALLGLRQG